MATMVSNDGEIFSAFGNARQNGLSAFRFDSVTAVQPGQIVYLRDLDSGETDAPGFAPFQRERRDSRCGLRAGRRDVHNDARRSRDGICRLRAAGLSRRHAASDPAQSRGEAEAPARRAVLRSRARRQPEREHRQDSRRDGRLDASRSTIPTTISCAASPSPRRASRDRRPRPSARDSSAGRDAIS